jgi:hypothetical protein
VELASWRGSGAESQSWLEAHKVNFWIGGTNSLEWFCY